MNEVFEYLNKEAKITDNDTIVIGVSGGPDSMALLHLMIKLREKKKIKLICAHVNHNVRSESAAEAVFVEKFCHQNDVIFETMTIETYGDSNFHNEARSIRYNYFETLIEKYNATYLLTAHHGDDLIETILMRLVRGSSLHGYSGFSKVINKGKYQIIRPLITVTKDDILSYCKENNISYVQDKSNQKDVYTRNRFRKYVLPLLKQEEPNVHTKFYKFSNVLLEYDAFVEKQTQPIIDEVYIDGTLNIDKFIKQDHLIQMKIISHILETTYQDDLMLISDVHAELIYNLINSKRANAIIHLPNNIVASKSYQMIEFKQKEEESVDYNIKLNLFVNLPNGKNIELVTESNEVDNNICRLNSNDLTLPLYVRNRENGDKMSVKGMIGHKKINDIFVDTKITTNERNMWPVVVDSKGVIVWLPGLKKSKLDKTKLQSYDIILRYY